MKQVFLLILLLFIVLFISVDSAYSAEVREDSCDQQMPGDADVDGVIGVGDIDLLMQYLFAGGPPPTVLANGDANGDCIIDMDDVQLINLSINDPFNFQCVDCTCISPRLGGVSIICGDTDGSDEIDISDAVFLIAYIFNGGTAPNPLENADVDCSSAVDISDAVYLIAYIFNGGSAPCAGCQ